MFTYGIVSASHFTSKADGRESYRQWCLDVGLHEEQFPFSVKSHKLYKNKPIVHHVTSWGYYENADGNLRIFVAYRFNGMKHTTQYAWQVGGDNKAVGDPVKWEWIGG